ncbi:MAG: transposase, partial [Methylococcales bacterium]
MKRFLLEQSNTEFYTSHSGLALVGLCLNRFTTLIKSLWEEVIPLRHGIAHSDIIQSYLGLLCSGKSDFEAVENVRTNRFFKEALGIDQVPSASRLRQRLDEYAKALLPMMYAIVIEFLMKAEVPVTPLAIGYVALDIDVFPMDNSGTSKEGVSRTYKGVDGYASIAAYLGEEGWCLACELREGKQHCQNEFLYTLERVLPNARKLTSRPILVRLDSGHDAW